MDPSKLLHETLKRQDELRRETFECPPATLEQFQNMLGRHQELSLLAERLQKLISNDEE